MAHGGRRRGSGPPPKPVEQKIVEGTFRRDRDGDKPGVDEALAALEGDGAGLDAETKERPASAPLPGLSPRELELWRQALEHFGGWTKTSDAFALLGLVSLMELLLQNREARAASELAGHMVAYKRRQVGKVVHLEAKEHPLVMQQLRITASLRQWLAEFGATPAARTQMRPEAPPTGRASKAEPADEFERFLRQQRG